MKGVINMFKISVFICKSVKAIADHVQMEVLYFNTGQQYVIKLVDLVLSKILKELIAKNVVKLVMTVKTIQQIALLVDL
jgi:hypothetical protein